MSKEIFISIANQKGGVGKSTLTTIIANLLHFEHGYTIAVVDCDSPQASTADLRDFEIKVIRNSPVQSNIGERSLCTPTARCIHAVNKRFDAFLYSRVI